jgi:hypothetical protein
MGGAVSEVLREPSRGTQDVLETWNGEPVDAASVPVLPVQRFRATILAVVRAGGRLATLHGRPEGDRTRLTAVLADDPEGRLGLLSAVVDRTFPSLSAEIPAAQAF